MFLCRRVLPTHRAVNCALLPGSSASVTTFGRPLLTGDNWYIADGETFWRRDHLRRVEVSQRTLSWRWQVPTLFCPKALNHLNALLHFVALDLSKINVSSDISLYM
ncbi:MAG: hypothetical protein ACYCUV_02235 [Phycisphaerae bacterium]